MSAMSDLQTLTDERETFIIRLAEMAGILRDVRRVGAAEPVLCLLDCDPHHHIPLWHGERCTSCGSAVLPASTWHRLLTAELRAASARAPHWERRAA